MNAKSEAVEEVTLRGALSMVANLEGEPFVTLREAEATALYRLHGEMLQLLADALSSAEGWSASDEDRAAAIVRKYL